MNIKDFNLTFIVNYKMFIMRKKWFWKMDYCWVNKIPPAQKWAWDEAEKAYNHSNVKSNNF